MNRISLRRPHFYNRQILQDGNILEVREAFRQLISEHEQLWDWIDSQGIEPKQFDPPIGLQLDVVNDPITDFEHYYSKRAGDHVRERASCLTLIQ